MRKEILTKLSKNEITVEEAEERLDNHERFQNYLNRLDEEEGWPLLSARELEVIPTIIAHEPFEFDKNDIDTDRLDAILAMYQGRYKSVKNYANEYWGRLLNSNSHTAVANFKNKYKSDVSNWINEALASGELKVIPFENDVLIFCKCVR